MNCALDGKSTEQRRQEKARPILEKLHDWMLAQRTLVPDGSGTAKALDYSLKRWAALTRYLEDGYVPIDNNHIEQQIRPLALGRKNWLFAGSLRDRKSTRLNSSHVAISYAVFCLKKKTDKNRYMVVC